MMRPAMPIAVLYPRYDHSAIEERYASWQTQMLLRFRNVKRDEAPQIHDQPRTR